MTWQEELRQLDSALAGGELSANEYRKRRDEILAAASSAQPPSPVLGAPAGPRPEGEADAGEVTQVVNVDNGETEADVTQIITDPAKSNGTEHTQVVAPVSPADGPTSPALQPQQTQWASLPPSQNAQTGVATFPPVPPQIGGPAPTPLDAQDLFTSNKLPRGGKKPLLIALAVVVVLALAGGAVWFFGFSGDDGTDTAGETNSPTTEEAPPPEPVDITKIELPGKASQNSGEMDISRASQLQVIAPSEATLIADAGARQLTYSGYADGDYRFMLYAYKSESPAAAQELTDKLLGIQKRLGYTDTSVDGVPEQVTVTTVSNAEAASVRGVYTYGDTTIQLSVLQDPVGDVAQLHAQFQQGMTAVTDAAPPAR